MKKWFLLFFVTLLGSVVLAQQRDIGIWTSVNLERKFLKKTLAIGGSLNLRLDENVSNMSGYFGEAYLDYKFWKLFSLGAEYRLSMKRADYGGYTPKHRFSAVFGIKKKLAPLEASVRLKYQYSMDARKRTDFFQPIADHALRIKVKIAYDDWKKVKPFIGNEFFYDFGNHKLGKRFNAYRLSAGLKYKISKRHAIKVAYVYNLEINVTNPLREHIASVGYFYSIKNHKGKKKSKK